MLTNEQLPIGDSYRRGYHDGYAGRKKREDKDVTPSPGLDPWRLGERPFVGFDYSEGYKAGAIDGDGIVKQLQVSDCIPYIRKSSTLPLSTAPSSCGSDFVPSLTFGQQTGRVMRRTAY